MAANASVDCDGCLVSHQAGMKIHLGVIKFHRATTTSPPNPPAPTPAPNSFAHAQETRRFQP